MDAQTGQMGSGEGVCILREALKQNTSLTKLDLDREHKNEHGAGKPQQELGASRDRPAKARSASAERDAQGQWLSCGAVTDK